VNNSRKCKGLLRRASFLIFRIHAAARNDKGGLFYNLVLKQSMQLLNFLPSLRTRPHEDLT